MNRESGTDTTELAWRKLSEQRVGGTMNGESQNWPKEVLRTDGDVGPGMECRLLEMLTRVVELAWISL